MRARACRLKLRTPKPARLPSNSSRPSPPGAAKGNVGRGRQHSQAARPRVFVAKEDESPSKRALTRIRVLAIFALYSLDQILNHGKAARPHMVSTTRNWALPLIMRA